MDNGAECEPGTYSVGLQYIYVDHMAHTVSSGKFFKNLDLVHHLGYIP